MKPDSQYNFQNKVTLAGAVISMGIVFGDIGTSPIYTQNAIFHDRIITESIAIGSLSCIFWTLFFQTSLKYIVITLQADNKGEGGIFSLYALIRRYWGKWLIVPAIAGGAFLMADGIITPPISVASAIEGLRVVYPDINTLPIVITILAALFIFQQFGTEKIGKVFGPIMIIWFTFIGAVGWYALSNNYSVLKALNPYYAYHLIVVEPRGFWLLGAIFLCTTGAEALYSDMGHCGKNNIRVSWIYIKLMLILSYAGQTAWLVAHQGGTITTVSPFYQIIPTPIYWPALTIATLATIIASQALISGCFTLVNEAIRLEIWPRLLVAFPGRIKGQLYIPAINWLLMAGCIGMVLYFKESTRMEAAFGLSVTLTMLMSTFLINFFLHSKRIPLVFILMITGVFLTIETTFLIANLQKFQQGGFITIIIGICLSALMLIWWSGKIIKRKITETVNLDLYMPKLRHLSEDPLIQKCATNLVYLTTSSTPNRIEKTIVESILTGSLKRADVYWFLHINITDEPFTLEYSVHTLDKNNVYFIVFNMGFRVEPRVDYYFRSAVNDMINRNEVDLSERHEKEYQESRIGDIKFVMMNSFLSFDNELPFFKNLIMKMYFLIKKWSVREDINFGLDRSHVLFENYPLIIQPVEHLQLTRIDN